MESAQRNTFADVKELLLKQCKNQMINKFRLFINESGIIHCAGRFYHASLPFEEKNPILLPKPTKNAYVKLLVLHVHELQKHTGVSITPAAIRERYWISSGRKKLQ